MVGEIKFTDALSLSWRNIVQHKGRSAIIVLTISILFGVIMGVNFVLRGLEVSLLETSVARTGGKAYVVSYYADRINSGPNSVNVDVQEQIEKYHGKELGRLKTYSFRAVDGNDRYTGFHSFEVVDLSAVEAFVTVDWSSIPEGKIPVLVREGGYQTNKDEWLSTELADKYYVVGYLPEVNVTYSSQPPELGVGNGYTPTLGGFNLLNLVLGNVGVEGETLAQPLIVDDGSDVVAQYLNERIADWKYAQQQQVEQGNLWEVREEPQVEEKLVAVFDDPLDLISLAAVDPGLASGVVTSDFISNSDGVAEAFYGSWMMLMVIEVIVLVVAVVVATFTFAHLVDQDASTLALYRSMGATTNDMYLIYFLYLLELCGIAIIASCLFGVVISGVVALMNVGSLASRWQEYYVLAEMPKVSLFGIDWHFWLVILVILLIAPVSLIFTQDRFSSKHVAKQLKED